MTDEPIEVDSTGVQEDEVLRWIYAHPWAVKGLTLAVNHEYKYHAIWRWYEVRVTKANLDRMVLDGILTKDTYGYMTANYEATVRALNRYLADIKEAEYQKEEYSAGHTQELPAPAGVPRDLFDSLIGYDELKRELMMALNSRLHVLLWGAPGTGKSIAMECILKLPGSKLIFAGKGQMTAAGVRRTLLQDTPRYLCVDELEKADGGELNILLEVLERKTLTITQNNQMQQAEMDVQVFAAANRVDRISEELRDRFHTIKFPKFSSEDFRRVTMAYLTREGASREVANVIATGLMAKSRSIRDAIRIAKMAKTAEDAEFLVRRLGQETRL